VKKKQKRIKDQRKSLRRGKKVLQKISRKESV
jgi:hypothetical protein